MIESEEKKMFEIVNDMINNISTEEIEEIISSNDYNEVASFDKTDLVILLVKIINDMMNN